MDARPKRNGNPGRLDAAGEVGYTTEDGEGGAAATEGHRAVSSITVRAPGSRGLAARSRWSKLKLVTAVAYGAIVLGTVVFVALPRGGPRTLGARVTVLPGDPLMGRYFIVQNESSRDWVAVRFEIDGGYQTRRDAVLAGQKLTLYLRDFTRQETVTVKRKQKVQSLSPPSAMPVTFLRIESRGRRQTLRLEADS